MKKFLIIIVFFIIITSPVRAYISSGQSVKFDSHPFKCSVHSTKHTDIVYLKVSKSNKDKMYLIMDDGDSHGILSGSFKVTLWRDYSNDNYYGDMAGKEYSFKRNYNNLDGAHMVLNGDEKVIIKQKLCTILTDKQWVLSTGVND